MERRKKVRAERYQAYWPLPGLEFMASKLGAMEGFH
jgi:hypothetical protein